MADRHTVRRARVPFQKISAPNRTAEERDRPLTYPEEGQGRNRIAEGERRPSPPPGHGFEHRDPSASVSRSTSGSSVSARVHERSERAKGEAGPCHRTGGNEPHRKPLRHRDRVSPGTPTPRGNRSTRAPGRGHRLGVATRHGRTGRQPLHWCRPQGASKRFVGQGPGVLHHPRGRSLSSLCSIF